MGKKVMPVIIILVLLVGLYGAYRVYKHFARLAAPGAQTQTVTSPSTTSSLRDLIAKGVAQSCTFSSDRTSGTVYVSSGKVRGDFTTTLSGAETKSHMLAINGTSYIWTDGQKTGFKMSFDPNATPAAGSTSSTANGSFDTTVNMNYKCSTWVVDNSLLTPPTGVTFRTFTTPTQTQVQGSPSGSSSNSSQCSYCDALSGSDKTQCLAALNCK